jgi:hypothetical protein
VLCFMVFPFSWLAETARLAAEHLRWNLAAWAGSVNLQ